MTQPKPLTTQQLDDIDARANAATPGPWEEHTEYGPHFYAYLRGPYLRGVGTLNFGDGEDAAADREFVAHAPEDVRALLAEIRWLRSELTAHRADVLGEVAVELEGIDFHPNAKVTASDLCRMLAHRFRRHALDGLDAARRAPATP